MNNFTQRALTGAAFILVIISSVVFSFYSLLFLFTLVVLLGLWEFFGLLEKADYEPQKIVGTIIGVVGFLVLATSTSKAYPFFLIIPVFFFLLELFRNKKQPFINVAFTILGIIYVALPFALLAQQSFSGEQYSYQLILGLFFLIWSNDTFAYLAGRWLGKRKLFERISPKKTWEGTIGGVVFTLITSYVLSLYFNDLDLFQWLTIAFIVSVAGTLGDLVESMLKRSLNVKDSGNILPGHGGILDRFDSFLLCAPFVVVFYWLIK